jgi:hypothetical protein
MTASVTVAQGSSEDGSRPDHDGLLTGDPRNVPAIWTNPVERGALGLVTRHASAHFDWLMVKHAAYHLREVRLYTYGSQA